MITVIDIKIGNVGSVTRALEKLKFPYQVTDNPELIKKSEKMIMTGVGSYREASNRMKLLGIDSAIRQKVIEEKTPILGICLGMQLLASVGMEGGESEGLGLIKGKVKYHRCTSLDMRLPHVGWNNVHSGDLSLFKSLPENSHFYFVHSYELLLDEDIPIATCNYGVNFVAAIQKDNIMGTQFHPEKSQTAGLSLMQNFLKGLS
ncbi:MAG: imidazole glycerol phosphate synthase subunit HisH [Gammaproteobacteria bacterium]|nr:imidazole glycerol phosphate synthase subunit HisH [Gammaproteobacteria bacterium]